MVGTKFHALHILQFLPADIKTKLGHGGGQSINGCSEYFLLTPPMPAKLLKLAEV